jgi:hypothetical protein
MATALCEPLAAAPKADAALHDQGFIDGDIRNACSDKETNNSLYANRRAYKSSPIVNP